MKKMISRKVALYTLAAVFGLGAFTFSYAAVYTAGPICYNGRTTTVSSAKSQADADSKMAKMLSMSPSNYMGACTEGTTPTTPGSP